MEAGAAALMVAARCRPPLPPPPDQPPGQLGRAGWQRQAPRQATKVATHEAEIVRLLVAVFDALAKQRPELSLVPFTDEYLRLADHYFDLLLRRPGFGELPITVTHPRC